MKSLIFDYITAEPEHAGISDKDDFGEIISFEQDNDKITVDFKFWHFDAGF
jgi:hypothetical protein